MKIILKAALLAFIAVTGTAHALPVSGQGTWETTLQRRDINGNGGADAFYDTALRITWLADADLHRGYGQASQMSFAAQLSFAGAEDWRLPNWVDTGVAGCNYSSGGTDCGFNTQTISGATVYSEMSHLFYVTLGNSLRCDYPYGNLRCDLTGPVNTGGFSGLGPSAFWTSGLNEGRGIYFDVNNGLQQDGQYQLGGTAMFVHDVDIFDPPAPAPITETETNALMLAVLALVGAVARRRSAA